MICSGVIVHLSGGMIEAHFHFFVMIPVIALYEAWAPFTLAVAYVLVHHGVMGTLNPRAVYNNPAAWQRPWLFAGGARRVLRLRVHRVRRQLVAARAGAPRRPVPDPAARDHRRHAPRRPDGDRPGREGPAAQPRRRRR